MTFPRGGSETKLPHGNLEELLHGLWLLTHRNAQFREQRYLDG